MVDCLAGTVNVTTGNTLNQWLAAINGHDLGALASLMAKDFMFVDSLGNRVDGAGAMAAGWKAYFAMCPDFWLHADQIMAEDETILMVGETGGTIDGARWCIPAAWKAVIRNGSVIEWRVFADNKPVYEILARR